MANVKFNKVGLLALQKKLAMFQKYLPTLQLKKILLQKEVNSASEEIERSYKRFFQERQLVGKHSKILSDPKFVGCEGYFNIKEVVTTFENIAGVNVPVMQNVMFKEFDVDLAIQPIWLSGMIAMIRSLKKSRQKVYIAIEREKILKKELRTVSIRVNLFEKRLIPETEKYINAIKIFLGDQDVQSIVQAKAAKRIASSQRIDEGTLA